MLFTMEKYHNFFRSDTCKTIHDDDALCHVTSRATYYDVITASQVASNSSLCILFQYEHHRIYLKSILFSVSEKETNFSITPRII